MHPQQVLKGFQGRRKNGTVMVCSPCKAGQGGGGQAYEAHQTTMIWVAVIGLTAMALLAGLVASVRGY